MTFDELTTLTKRKYQAMVESDRRRTDWESGYFQANKEFLTSLKKLDRDSVPPAFERLKMGAAKSVFANLCATAGNETEIQAAAATSVYAGHCFAEAYLADWNKEHAPDIMDDPNDDD